MAEDVVKADLGKLLLTLEAVQDEAIAAAQQPQASTVVEAGRGRARRGAGAAARRRDLLERIARRLRAAAGSSARRRTSWSATWRPCRASSTGRSPLLIQSTSAAGKILAAWTRCSRFVPEEERVKYSAMTGQSLFYMGETNLKHKILAIVEEEGAQPRELRAEAPAERGRADDRLDRQGSGDRQAGHAGVPRRRAGDDLL